MHPSIFSLLNDIGWECIDVSAKSFEEISPIINNFEGLFVRTRTRVDASLRDKVRKAIKGGMNYSQATREFGISYPVVKKIEDGAYDHAAFRPWRLQTAAFKALRRLRPDYDLWRDFPYEYERDKNPFDILSGSEQLRLQIEVGDSARDIARAWRADEEAFRRTREPYLIYPPR